MPQWRASRWCSISRLTTGLRAQLDKEALSEQLNARSRELQRLNRRCSASFTRWTTRTATSRMAWVAIVKRLAVLLDARVGLRSRPGKGSVLWLDLAHRPSSQEADRSARGGLLRQQAGRQVPTSLVTGDTDAARVRAAYDSGLVVMFKAVQPEHLLDIPHTALLDHA